MWYVIQTQTGKEQLVRTLIEQMVSPEIYEECRIIRIETKRKYQGEWHVVTGNMFPGYLFLVAPGDEGLKQELRKIPEMTKILGDEEALIPISAKEEAFLRHLCGDDSNVEMSYGIQIGDQVIVQQGSLKGFESVIRKIDRHKRKAYIEVELLGQKRLVEVGLEIVEKRKYKRNVN